LAQHDYLFFAFAGIALGILGGSIMDKKLKKSKRENKEFL